MNGSPTINFYLVEVGSSGWAVANSAVVQLSTTWQRFDLTATTQTALTELVLQVGGGGSMTSGAVIDVWGAQVVVGSVEGNYVATSTAANGGGYLAANGMNQSYSYDSFGNMVSAGNYNFVQAFTSANQLSGWSYDNAGNLLSDGLGNNYVYDALGQITSDGATSYVYDANGDRVAKMGSAETDTMYFGGRPIARVSGGAWTDLIYGPSALLAEVPGSQTGAPIYRMVDHLGTSVGTLSSTGAVLSIQDLAPFGQLFAGGTGDTYQFTGKERDAESGLDYFGARYYASNMGRFMSPDWSAKVEPVPYSKLDNPQTLNLYAYVGNNPLSRTDPTGHADIAAQCQGKPSCNVTLTQTVNIVHQQTDKVTGATKTVVDSTLKVTTNFSVTTDAKGNMSTTASSTVANVSGAKFSDSQLATMGKDIGTMQQAAVGMGFGANTTELVTAVGAAESHFGASPPYSGAPGYMNPAINPMQLTGGNGANMDLNHNVEGGMGILDWAGRPSTFDPTATYTRYSDHSPATMANWNAIYGSINETQP